MKHLLLAVIACSILMLSPAAKAESFKPGTYNAIYELGGQVIVISIKISKIKKASGYEVSGYFGTMQNRYKIGGLYSVARNSLRARVVVPKAEEQPVINGLFDRPNGSVDVIVYLPAAAVYRMGPPLNTLARVQFPFVCTRSGKRNKDFAGRWYDLRMDDDDPSYAWDQFRVSRASKSRQLVGSFWLPLGVYGSINGPAAGYAWSGLFRIGEGIGGFWFWYDDGPQMDWLRGRLYIGASDYVDLTFLKIPDTQ